MDEPVHFGRPLAGRAAFVQGRTVRHFQRSWVRRIFKRIYQRLAVVVCRTIIKLVVVLLGPAIAPEKA
jgi:hypothetical protein